ncbi:MAG: DUF1553 domain-containing protein [Planctomycetales bacterium]|nr:DUF1553 domain-containing protein [Planctomycetales bacterium]
MRSLIGICLAAVAVATLLACRLGAADANAPADATPAPPDPDVYAIRQTDDDRNHWAFRPVPPVQPPTLGRQADWVRNPIDSFILQRLHERGMSPSPAADDRTWLRRVSFDLIGLPPTPEQVDEFLNDTSPNARERVVDRLLADTGYGVRWGRRWLDVVRYADTNGYERDGNKPHVWRYRDYVIDSLNADKPFDRFLTEQLAGDELDDANAESMIATTFLRLGTWDDEPADPLVDRYDQLDDVIGTVSATFLGLTLRCARCHNHKFEPLSQIDYARMLAVFEPLKRPQRDREELDVAVGTREERTNYSAAVARRDAALQSLRDQLKVLDDQVRERFFRNKPTQLTAEAIEAHRLPETQRNAAQKKLAKETQKQFDDDVAKIRTADEQRQRSGFESASQAIQSSGPTELPRAYILHEPAGPPPVTQVFRRGNPTTPAGVVSPGIPVVLSGTATPALPPSDRATRHRLSLATWMTDAKNPLVSRVIVNRLWQGHFGNGLVGTENDFGTAGDAPTHPELLDWLAAELLRNGWRLKPIHKLIVLSNTYGQSSVRREDAEKLDTANDLLWRFPYRRLEAEAIRDAVLAVNGQLNLKMSGPGMFPRIAPEVLAGQSRPGAGWGAFDEREASRRSVFVFVKRSLVVPEFELLDFADTNASCEQRPVSTIPTQALTLLNGEFFNQQAKHFAERLIRDTGADPTPQIAKAYHLALSRPPTSEEVAAALAFLDRQAKRLRDEAGTAEQPSADPTKLALQALCLVLYNLNEFVYVD